MEAYGRYKQIFECMTTKKSVTTSSQSELDPLTWHVDMSKKLELIELLKNNGSNPNRNP